METQRTYNFLILEDNPSDALLVRREIEKNWEHALIKVISGPNDLRTALGEIEWDVVISDYAMPQFTGLDALRITQESNQNPYFFLISGVIGEEIAKDAMQAGAWDFIDKNKSGRLVISIRRALAEQEEKKELNVARIRLQTSEKKYQEIVSMAPVGIYQSSINGRFLEANRSLANMLGYADVWELMSAVTLNDIYYIPGERQRLIEMYDIYGAGHSENTEIQYKKKDGSSLWVLLTSWAVKDVNGQTLYYNGFVVDVSQLKAAEMKIQKILSNWQNTLNSMTDIIMMLSPNREILEINEAGCRVLGLSREQILGQFCYKLIHKTDSPPDFCPIRKAEISKKMEVSEIYENGKFFQITAWPIMDSERRITGFSHAIRDISERKLVEQELIKYREHLEELVTERTQELKEANADLKKKNLALEDMQKLFTGREFRIKDLRDQVKNLKEQLHALRQKYSEDSN